MPYTTPPTFADGNILTAAQLNILSSNQEYLNGRLPALNPPFSSHVYTGSGEIGGQAQWWFRYTHRYMHYKFQLNGAISALLELSINGNDTILDSTPSGLFTYEDSVDMNGYSLTLGDWYSATFTGNKTSGSATAFWLFQSPVA